MSREQRVKVLLINGRSGDKQAILSAAVAVGFSDTFVVCKAKTADIAEGIVELAPAVIVFCAPIDRDVVMEIHKMFPSQKMIILYNNLDELHSSGLDLMFEKNMSSVLRSRSGSWAKNVFKRL